VIRYRPFLNSDPPHLVEIWRSQPPERGLVQPMSVALLDQFIFAKPYFDRHGFIVAVDDDRPVGFVHAAFGPTDDQRQLSTDWGVTCLVMVRPNYQRQGIGAELLKQAETYLQGRGAKVLYAGGIRPLNGFYVGLYGGSELPGVLDSTPRAQKLFQSGGYREIDRTVVMQRDLMSFRPPVDRVQMQIRRKHCVQVAYDPPPRNWWEACTYGCFDRARFDLLQTQGATILASALFWNLQPLASSWGVQAAGLYELEVRPELRRQGFATFLLGEAFKQFQSQNVSLVEVQTMKSNDAAQKLYQKLGFQTIDQGAVYRKES
jgi:ribosomal protein S18 acetylase RimI-like enzyme